ncbi:MAG: LLM class F420-dependent oxidoreductase [Chloroflexi bacterium]|nr:LLM class F420-dependent oxidoreductase [Chloroflexota bacterium]
MLFGVTMFPADYAIPVPTLAKEAEARGLDSLWLPEHTHIPTQHTPFPSGGTLPNEYRHTLDPFVALAGAATVTTKLTLGTGILLVIQRDTITTAKEAASLDFLSGGRFQLGIGAGWNREEMGNHGTAFPTRWRKMREQMLAMKAIWTKDEAEYHGDFVTFDPIWQWPKPVQKPHVPIIIGGDGPKAIEAVVEYGDGWIPRPQDRFAPLAERIATVKQRLAERGRGPIPISVFGTQPDPAVVEEYERIGVTQCVFRLPPAPADEVLPALDRYASLLHHFA